MNGIRGKMITQGGHAYLHAFWDAELRFPENAAAYRNSDHAYKITLVVDTDEDLRQLFAAYREICGASLVEDAGFTVFKEPTVTALGLGPLAEGQIGEDLRGLKLFT